ncbi:methionyl-tRNA formyltransferase [Lagierella massiliensis]|uniref:methionyl-tRNA formyltransferase n=1 Tax=Lagierella massiliensis TaxID=1689303 RepID=UPI0006D81FFB|nr:methionyl-tRNA formyltransferase [Lagierella massiliensis]
MKPKVIFLGTPEFAVESLKAIYESKKFEIPLIISQVDRKRNRGKMTPTPVKQYALDNDLEVFTPEDINSDVSFEKINSYDPDFLVVVAYGQIIKDRLLSEYNDRILNVHSSLLPKYRGAAPINWAIAEGEDKSGITIMLVEKGLDTGDILYSLEKEIVPDENAEELHDALKVLGGKGIVEVLENFDEYYENRRKQNEEEASYRGMLNRKDGKILWDDTCLNIYNKFRGFYPWPGSFFKYEEHNVKVLDMDYVLGEVKHEPGFVEQVGPEIIKITAKDGYILLKEIQFPNKKRMKVSDFLKGNEFKKNIYLK